MARNNKDCNQDVSALRCPSEQLKYISISAASCSKQTHSSASVIQQEEEQEKNISLTSEKTVSNVTTQTEAWLEKSTNTKTKRSHKQELQNALNVAKKMLHPQLTALLESYISNMYRDSGLRYSEEVMQLSLSLYIISPKGYRFLPSLLQLPDETTVKRYIRKWPAGPGILNIYFETLKLKMLSFSEIGKVCMISIDEMPIKTHLDYDRLKDMIVGFEDDGESRSKNAANHVFVIMVRGIVQNWNHFLGYAFVKNRCSAKTAKDMVFACIRQLRSIGLKPKILVCDQGANFIKLSHLLPISPYSSTFKVDHEGDDLYFLFDPPHLLKSLWNNLMRFDITFDEGKTAQWQHVVEFYEKETTQKFKFAPELTDNHINPTLFQKNSVQLASQIFSHAVAVGIYARSSFNKIASNGLHTPELLDAIHTLFDIFNSKTLTSSTKMRRKKNEKQVAHLKKMHAMFETMQVTKGDTNLTSKMNFIKGWRITINSLLNILEAVKCGGLEYIVTRNLNQDSLKSAFRFLRRKCGNSTNPTPMQFASLFKKHFCTKFSELKRNGNNEQQEELALPLVNLVYSTNGAARQAVNIMCNDIDIEMNLAERNAFHYVGEYILKRHRDNHNCQHSETSFIHCKEYDEATLYRPPQEFMVYLEKLEEKFSANFDAFVTEDGLINNLTQTMKTVPYTACCKDANADFIIKLYAMIRLKYILKQFNNSEEKNINSLTQVNFIGKV